MSDFLYESIKKEFGRELREDKNYSYVNNNLNPKLKLRAYQKEAFNRFYLYFENDDIQEYTKVSSNIHLCFNMATGSGKTLIMSGLILYLYNQGYRNFLFFVNRGQIVEKTKDNFINSYSNKYLFNQKIIFNNQEIKIKAVNNFSSTNKDDINICFTTIQKLFGDMNIEKEGAITLESFKNQKIVLISDEAHHMNVNTKKKYSMKQIGLFDEVKEVASWENSIEKIFKCNKDNILLDFTATLELDNSKVKEKYLDKIIFKYDLKDFVKDRYSKRIELFKSDTNKTQRILQALLSSIYKEYIAVQYYLDIKPIILFKSSKIKESQDNQNEFNTLISNLDIKDLQNIKDTTNIKILKKIFDYFDKNSISLYTVCQKIKISFSSKKILCTNSDEQLQNNQKLLNSLEDKNNIIRAIFSVDKLNEGWDVLNLFDIVRLYDGQSSGGASNGKLGKKTISEAQLIGRGARYFPFCIKDDEDIYKRKYDDDINHDLRVLEMLYFHSQSESRYISEITKALQDIGIMEEDDKKPIELSMKLKDEFITTGFLSKKIFLNSRRKKRYNYVKKLSDLGVSKVNFEYRLQTLKGSLIDPFNHQSLDEKKLNTNKKSKNLVDFIGFNIISNALLYNDFYRLDSLKISLPNLKSIKEFIISKEYLKQFNIDIVDSMNKIDSLNSKEKLNIALSFLNLLQNEMKNSIVEYEGTKSFKPERFDKVFKNKVLLVPKEKEKKIIKNSDNWFVYKEFYGTTQEKSLIELIGKMIDDIKSKYRQNDIYLIRNERHFKIYNFDDGAAFEPDFVLFLQNQDDDIHFQIFCEPKGKHLVQKDRWKEKFLLDIRNKIKNEIIEFENEKYRIFGMKFYESSDENSFEKDLKMELNI